MARRSLIAWVVALAFVCSACAVDTTVTVKVREDGTGFVRVDVTADAEAVQQAEVGGGKLEDRVRLTDLPAAGWTVEPWVRNADGSASLTLSKPFTDVDQVAGILHELNGDSGPLRDASFTRTRSILTTKFGGHATVDLGALQTGLLQDSDLVANLRAQGVDVDAVDRELVTQLGEALSVRLVVELPDGQRTVIEPAKGKAATLDASASVLDTRRVLFLVVGLLFVAAAVVAMLWPRRRVRHRRRETTAQTYRRGAAEHRPLSWDEATRERTPPGSGAPPRHRRR